MKRYLEHLQAQSPHARRQHAIRISTVVTSFVMLGWVATLGVRATTHTQVATGSPSQETQFANVIGGVETPKNTNTLEVSTTTNYTGL